MRRHEGDGLLGRGHARRSEVAQPHGSRTRVDAEHKAIVRDLVGHIMSASNRADNQPLDGRPAGRVLGSRRRRT